MAIEQKLVKNEFAGTTAPTVNDDSGDGFSVGSKWFDTTNDLAYVCMDATLTAAVWVLLTGLNVSLFTFTHTSGAASTGALGFVPAFCILIGAKDRAGAVSGMMVGFATGTGTSARAAHLSKSNSGASVEAGVDADAIGGSETSLNNFQTSIDTDLDVTAFGESNITLTWAAATVANFTGHLIVVG